MTFHVDNAFMPAQPQQTTPQGVVNLLTSAKDYQAKQAQADAYSQAIDPVTGAFDQNKYNAALRSGSPAGMWGAGAAMQQAGTASSALGVGTQEQVAAKRAQLGLVASWLTPIANADTPQSKEQAMAQLERAHQSGAMTDDIYQQGVALINQIPEGQDARKPAQSLLWINQQADKQLASTYPNYQPVQVGDRTVMVQTTPTQPGFGKPAAGYDIQHGVSPDTAAQVIDIKMSDGTVRQVQVGNAGAFLTANPGSTPASGPYTPGGGGGGNVTTSNFGPKGGRYNAPGNQNQQGGGGGTTPAPAPIPASPVAGGGTVQVPQPKPPVPAAPAPAPAVIGTGPNGQPIYAQPAPPPQPPNLLQPPPSAGPISVQNLPPPRQPPVVGPAGDPMMGGGMPLPPGPVTIPPPGPATTYAPGSTQGPGYTVGQGPATTAAPRTVTPTSGAPRGAAPYAQPPPAEPPPQAGVSPSAGTIASITAVTGRGTAAYNDLQNRVTSAKDQIALLDQMQQELKVRGWSPGFGATALGTLRQALMRAGITPSAPGPGFNVSDPQAAQEEFAKLSAQLATAQLAATGNATDARQEMVEAMTPGMTLTRYGNQGILSMLKGTQLATQVEGQAWQKAQDAGWLPGGSVQNNYNTWRNERFLATDPATGGRFDPRAFWVASMPNLAEQQKYTHTMDPYEQGQFLKNLKYAKSQGWITVRPDGTVVSNVGQQ